MNLVIVESPAKAKTIDKYLGASYEVLASFGHVRDLPAKNGSVDPDANFQMIWEISAASRLNDIARALKGADRLILATDPDREGEAISWHVLVEVMKEKRALKDQKIERVVFNAITKQEVTDAMKAPRQIDGATGRRLHGAPRRSIIWSASRSRRCCGANCPARARPAACSRSPCGWSSTANARSSVQRRILVASIATHRRTAPRVRALRSDASEQKRPATRASATSAKPMTREGHRSGGSLLHGHDGRNQACCAIHRRPSPPRRCSRRPPQARLCAGHTMRIAQAPLRGRDRSPICEPTACRWRRRRCRQRDARSPIARWRLCAGRAAPVRDQGEERAGSA